jgi:hypothetical protein
VLLALLAALCACKSAPDAAQVLDTSGFSALIRAQNGVQKLISGKGEPPPSVVWDGTVRSGLPPEGLYTAQLTLEYAIGSAPVAALSAPFRLDVSAPAVNVRLSPVPFSPDGNGVDDELTISIHAEDPSGIEPGTSTSWIPGGARSPFSQGPARLGRTFVGMGTPPRGSWSSPRTITQRRSGSATPSEMQRPPPRRSPWTFSCSGTLSD